MLPNNVGENLSGEKAATNDATTMIPAPTQGCLTAAIENTPDITNIFRVLSTFETAEALMSTQSLTAATKQEPNNGGLGEEKTFDLDILLREQQKFEDKEKVLAELSPVKVDCGQNEDMKISTATFTFNDNNSLGDESNCSTSTVASSSVKRTASKRKLSIESNVSSVSTVKNEQPAKKRGRRPVAAIEGASANVKSKYSKESVEDKTLVFFGNKKVEIGTDEYKQRRISNNEAVKKCREKAEREQQEREVKMKGLSDENQKLTDKVASLSKELEVLRGIIITMRTDNKLPETIQKLMNSI